ncbi:type IX secretion system sortase PorU [Rhodocaloribacter sp.]
MRSLFHFLIALACLAVYALRPSLDASAQRATMRTVETTARGVVLEVSVDWSLPLRASLDSARVSAVDEAFLLSLSQGLWTISENVVLPSLAEPRITVLASDFDEVDLPMNGARGALVEELLAEPVAGVGLGLLRKRPVITVQARLYGYDAGRGAFRQYRRLRIGVTFGRGEAAKATTTFRNPHLAVERSVLADGILFKIPVTEEGIYRIDRAFLSAVGAAVGLSPDDVEPNDLQIFGNGGAPLPALNSDDRIPDLAENPVFVRGGGDGSFDDGDVLLFYAAAPRGWRYDTENGTWTHYTHPFSNANYYFLKVGTVPGLRVGQEGFPEVAGATVLTQVTGRHVVDIDEIVWSKEHGSGHTWVSTQIRSGGSRDVFTDLSLPGLVSGEVTYRIRAAIGSNPVATVVFTANGTQIGQLRAPRPVGRSAEAPTAVPVEGTFTQGVSAGSSLSLSMRLLDQVNEPQAAVDWVRIFYPKALRAEGGVVRMSTPGGETGWFEFVLTGFGSEPQVWDVTEPGTIRRLGVQPSGNSYRVRVLAADPARPRELIAFTEGAALALDAETVSVTPNQNLHGDKSFPDFIIVTPTVFLEQANELAEHRRQDGLNVLVAVIDEIYNEFSGGLPDMRAPRDFFKFYYDRATSEDTMLRYALFFGDGHYDFRGLASEENELSNLLFPFETEESFVPDQSFTSDDYFGLLDDNEGIWFYKNFRTVSTERVDIGIGRFPVQTVEEAQLMVDKIKKYEDPSTFGPWRSLYTFVADDGPTGLSGLDNNFDLHMQNVDQVAELIRTSLSPALNVKKIYAESFERVFLNGFRIPEARREIIAALNDGTLLFNYSGHGGPEGLAQEELFTKEDAAALTNKDRQGIFVTATCSFGWWDIEDEQSGAEVLLLNPNGGVVALLTTVRLVYTSGDTTSLNAGLNRALNQILLTPDEDGRPRRLGDVMRLTKNTNVGLQGNSRKFNLLGDPTMRLGMPERTAMVETINGVEVANGSTQMRALDQITLSGTIRTPDGLVDEGFDGQVDVTVFDAVRRVSIIEQVYMPTPYYTVREDLIWRGGVQARDGRFTATFVVPKDISYSNEPGRVALYASSDAAQAMGFTENFIVGGTSPNPPKDAVGPEIALFLNDTTFVSGSMTTPEPELIVKFFDQSGLNTVGAGVGHEMLLVIDGDESNAVDISDSFRSAENSFRRGEVRRPLPRLEPGFHTLSVRAWDVLNNSGEAALDFYVAEDETLELRNVFNYPNPMSRLTRFVFEHNQPPGTEARIQVRIYSLNGRPIRTLDGDEALFGGVLSGGPVQIPWDGRDEDGDRVATGIYLYKVRVEVEREDGERDVVERIEKLAIIR